MLIEIYDDDDNTNNDSARKPSMNHLAPITFLLQFFCGIKEFSWIIVTFPKCWNWSITFVVEYF